MWPSVAVHLLQLEVFVPALPDVPGVIRTVLKYTLGNDSNVLNRLYTSFVGTANETNIAGWIANLITQWEAHMESLFHDSVRLTEVTATDLTTNTGEEVVTGVSAAGSRSGTPLGAGTALVVQMKIARRYRGGHPRNYLCAGVEGDLEDNQQWDGAALSAFSTGWNAWIAACLSDAPGGLTVGLMNNVSYYSGFTNFLEPTGRYRVIPTLRSSPVTDIIIDYAMNPQLGSQRRRNQQP